MTPTIASATTWSICNGPDGFESTNAAEWDEGPVSHISADQQEITPAMMLELENEEVDNAAIATVPVLPARSCTPAKESFKPIKTVTCWFWATPNKECRYDAEECRYLHAFLPARLGEPANKRTWGASASPSMSHSYPNTISHPISNEFKDRTRSSWSWANEGNLPTRDRAVDKYKPPYIKASKDWASGKLIKVVNVSDLPYVEMSLKIERCDYLASYNWLDSPKDPIILIPDQSYTFKQADFPSHPIEPSFRALLAIHPDVDLSSFDIVGCGSTLGNLLRFCEGIDKDFRFDVDRVRDTVFFIRKESSPRALIPNICGYGHSFHEAHTIWEPDVKGSVSHQRIIQYHFGGLKFLVRSESDGYLKQVADLDAQANDAETANAKDLPESEEDLVNAQQETEADNCTLLEALRITEGPSSIVRPLRIEMRGRQIPQKAIFDLKTRAKETRRPIDMNEVYRRLWVNQTPYFMFAEHFRGSFEPRDIQPVSVSDGISKWEKDCEALLKHYQATVMEIMTATRSSVTGKLQVIRRGSGPLEIQERASEDNTDVLPHDLRSKW